MSRPIWKGFITFGLVNIPVVLYSAEKKSDIRLKLVDSRDQARIHYARINEHTGAEVAWQDVAKGYEYQDGNYILLKEEDLKHIAGENSKTIDIENFVNKSSVDYIDLEKPYYLVPDKKGEKGYVILREILKDTKKIGIAKVFIHTHQYLAALMPYKDALMLNILRYHHEIRKPAEFALPTDSLKSYKISPKEMAIAKKLVDSMTAPWHPEHYKDEFRIALEQWIEDKIHHKKPIAHKKNKSVGGKGNIINFVDLLKKSLDDKKVQKNRKKMPKSKKVHNK
jgi:DNA end-binding protein Ku